MKIVSTLKIFLPSFLLILLPVLSQAQEQEDIIVCNEGNWQSDNGQLSYYDAKSGKVTNQWFRKKNSAKLGDTPNDIIQINDTLIAIAINWSNIIQYIHPDGSACGATEDVPNNRRMCASPDGRYLFITSYAHECGEKKFTRGYVAKIDLSKEGKPVVATCEVGWEPEGIRYYGGRLFVANTGGYAFQEDHEYETTVSVIDANTMKKLKDIDTGCINLYGEVSQAGRYLCINSAGDYYDQAPKTVILDCKDERVVKIFDIPCTYNSTDGRMFYTIGSSFSYYTNKYQWSINTIDPEKGTVSEGLFNSVITDKIKSLEAPYEVYVSPWTGNVYFTDAHSYANAGDLYGYTQDGKQLFAPQEVYVNPAHLLALPIQGKSFNDTTTKPKEESAYISKVYEYRPAPGQFVNNLPKWKEGDTAESMLIKANKALVGDNPSMITLGAWGGYVVFGFDHKVENIPGKVDFQVMGNAFFANANPNTSASKRGGSSEPAIIMVSEDTNGNGLPDDEWYEIAGSEYGKPQTIGNYRLTYHRPSPDKVATPDNSYRYYTDTTYVAWDDNQGQRGYVFKNSFHNQNYYPNWIASDTLTFSGSRLADNYVDESGRGTYYVQYAYGYGYADNVPNNDPMSKINIDWAVDAYGNKVHLDGINFVKVYTGVNQYCGWLGETSTEVCGAKDLHMLGEDEDDPTLGIISPRTDRGHGRVVYYDLLGRLVEKPQPGRLYIMKQGMKSRKVIFK